MSSSGRVSGGGRGSSSGRNSTRNDNNNSSSSGSYKTINRSPSKRDIEANKRVRSSNDVTISINAKKTTKTTKTTNPTSATSRNREIKGTLKYALLGHYMSVGTNLMCVVLGVFSLYWDKHSTVYACVLPGGTSIHSKYIGTYNSINELVCSTSYDAGYVCCDPYGDGDGDGIIPMTNNGIGILYIIYGIVNIMIIENTNIYGLRYPKESYSYQYRVSPTAIMQFSVGVAGLFDVSLLLAGSCLIITSIVYQYTVYIGEYTDKVLYDTDDLVLKMIPSDWSLESVCSLLYDNIAKVCIVVQRECESWLSWCSIISSYLNVYSHIRYIYHHDLIVFTVWVAIVLVANAILFSYTLFEWQNTIDEQADGLIGGTLDISSALNREIIRYGPLSVYIPWAKAFGSTLNMNCALIFFTTLPCLCEHIVHMQLALNSMITPNSIALLAVPLTSYLPLKQMFAFHNVYAALIFICTWGHAICHYSNIISSNNATMVYVSKWGWVGTSYFTGSILVIAMLIIYCGALSSLMEVTHHMMWIFIIILMLHSKYYFIWSLFPISLYLAERAWKRLRPTKPMAITSVDIISSFLVIKVIPVIKNDFTFKEGSYVYVNCPSISKSEWYPFPISSAIGDLKGTTKRIELLTGERVISSPRPTDLPHDCKWNKYIKESQDVSVLSSMDPMAPVFIDKHETGYDEFMSLHINTNVTTDTKEGLWISRLTRYLESVDAGATTDTLLPRHFYSLNDRNDIEVGVQFNADNVPIIRIDGPYLSFAENYTSYNTLMLIADTSDHGKGLVTCSSILSSLLNYRWKNTKGPNIIHCYWTVEQNQIQDYMWFLHAITDLSFEFKSLLESNPAAETYLEINIYVLKEDGGNIRKADSSINRARPYNDLTGYPIFNVNSLFNLMIDPTETSNDQIEKMKKDSPTNRLQDLWVWEGGPKWNLIFAEVDTNRIDKAVCVMNTSKDSDVNLELKKEMTKYTKVDSEFHLHSYSS